jgi:hypothetical protein
MISGSVDVCCSSTSNWLAKRKLCCPNHGIYYLTYIQGQFVKVNMAYFGSGGRVESQCRAVSMLLLPFMECISRFTYNMYRLS